MRWLLSLVLAACASQGGGDVVIDLAGDPGAEVTRLVHGPALVVINGADNRIVEAWWDGSWLAPRPVVGSMELMIEDEGDVTLKVWARGGKLSPVDRDRSLAWFAPEVLDGTISFAQLLGAISSNGNGGVLLDRWFRAFAAGPGAGRATFAQFLDEVTATQGADPAQWNLNALPFKVTGVHNRVDLANAESCGELRVSVASTHPTFAPVHFIFLFRQVPRVDDVTPDFIVHCRGTMRAWSRLTSLGDERFRAEAKQMLEFGITRERFVMAESVELSISPWQWRQWQLDASDTPTNPPLFQTIDVARVNAPGPTRDAFLAAVAANADDIAARRWAVPATFRSSVAEVQPNSKAPLVDLGTLEVPASLPRALGMIGCPRCHTDNADFIQTGADRKPSPFYDKELDARAARLDHLNSGFPETTPPFGPLQSFE